MIILYWPVVIIVTVMLYVLILVTLPFNQVYATVFLFALIGFWSRLPGVGIPTPFYVLYLADFVDFFSLIVAINIGGFWGGVFSVFLNLVSRFAGIFPEWLGVLKDTLSQFLTCLMIPYIHFAFGLDIFTSMILYSLIRIFWFFPMRLLPVLTSFPQFLVTVVGGGFAVLIINAVYARLFGDYLNQLLQQGVRFNWLLFLVATVVIFGFKIYFFGHSKSKKVSFRKIGRNMLRLTGIEKKKKKHKERDTEIEDFRKIKDRI